MDSVPTLAAAAAGSDMTTLGIPARYVGLLLAISSSFALGASPILTKKGLRGADHAEGLASESFSYLKNSVWWSGMALMVLGEVMNFAAYMFAPPVLVAPLGALSVIVGAVLAAFFLKETLGKIGIAGCSLCLVGSVVIVLHAPEDKPLNTIDDVLRYALQPGFLFYCFLSLILCLWLVYFVAPKHGHKTPVVFVAICSLSGSVSVMAVKGLGVALRVTLAGENQLWSGTFWLFLFTVVGCILVQMNYLNKALEVFPTNVVNPVYFVGFSGCTIIASIILFQGLYDTSGVDGASLICGFYLISLGVYLLNISRDIDHVHHHDPEHRDAMAMGRTHLLAQASSDDEDEFDNDEEGLVDEDETRIPMTGKGYKPRR